MCYDESLLIPLKEFIEKPDNRDFQDLITEAGESLRQTLENEDEFRNSDECIKEEIEGQGLEFDEDGNTI